MDLREVFARRTAKVEQLRNFIVLYGKKRETINELQALKSKTDDVQALLQQCSESVEKFQAHNKQRYLELIQRTKEQQCVMLNVLQKLDEMDEQRKISPPPPPPPSVFDVRNLNILKEINNRTPKSAVKSLETPCRLADYMKSPFTIRRMKPIALQFSDFEKIISEDDFNKVPSYMKGREALSEIQQFLEHVIIRCFTIKYTLLPKRKEAVAPNEMEIWNLYKSQETYFRGAKFITQGDICRLNNKQIDKKTSNRITILRHLKVLSEERKNSAICYIWNTK